MKLLILGVLLILLVVPVVKADGVLVGNTPVTSPALAVSSDEFLAQPFVLTGTATVSEVNVLFIADLANSVFDLEITNGLGSSANVLAQAVFSNPLPFNPPPMTFSIPLNQTLSAGTYYIVASTPSGSKGGGWIEGVAPTVGTIPPLFFANSPNNDSTFPPASNWAKLSETANFQVIGTQMPEPGSLVLLCSGILAIGVLRRGFSS